MYSFKTDLLPAIQKDNLIPRLQAGGLLNNRHVDIDSKKLHKIDAIKTEPYWVYINPNPKLYCTEYRAIEKGFGFIPQACRNCYKVVVEPRSFHELMQLYDLQEEMVLENPRCWCKCGIEEREFVPRDYGGYFYTQGIDVGKTRWKTVREKVNKSISEETPVILKRYCTEFELQHGPSDKYFPPEGSDELEKQIWETIEIVSGGIKQPQFIINNTIQTWMIFAWGRGDMTVKLYNNGKPLFRPSVTYHDELVRNIEINKGGGK